MKPSAFWIKIPIWILRQEKMSVSAMKRSSKSKKQPNSSRIPIGKEDGFPYLSLKFYNWGLAKNAPPLLFQGWVIVEQSLEACTSLLLCWSTVKLGVFEVLQKKLYFVSKIVLFSDQEKLLNFEAEGREFPKCLKSLEKFIQTVKGQYNFWNRMIFLTYSRRILRFDN